MLYAAVEQAPSAEVVEPEILSRYFAKFDEQFFSYCDKELAKINTFYSGMDTCFNDISRYLLIRILLHSMFEFQIPKIKTVGGIYK